MFEFDETIEWILGRPNFWCGPYAHRLRDLGHRISTKAEAEQAYVIYKMLELYERHGDAWQKEFYKLLKLGEKVNEQD